MKYPANEGETRSTIELDAELRQRLLDALMNPVEARRMSFDEFMAWADEDTRAEWVDGDVVMTSPASKRHQLVAGFLSEVVSMYCRLKGLGQVLQAPFVMKLARSAREPDLIFVRQDHLERLQDTYLDGPADLAVEVLSPESAGRDRGDKFYEYEEAGVAEYWLIDPQREQAEYYLLGDNGRYALVLSGAGGVYHSRVVAGFWLDTAWLWAEPLPSPLRTVATIAGIDPNLADAFEQAVAQGGYVKGAGEV